MKKLIPVILICLMLTACNFPTAKLSSEEVVQTNVALILTNAPETTLLPDGTQEPETPENSSEDTPVAAIEPTSGEPAAPEPEPTATEIPQPTATTPPTPTATPEPLAGDPVTQLGAPDFLDEFNSAERWAYEDDWFLLTVSGGQLHAYSKGTPYWSSWYTTHPETKDAYFETTFTRPNCSGKDRFGLVIRWDESQQFYYMGVTCDGTWGFSFYTKDNQIINILDYQSSDAFKPAAEPNRIGILAKGNHFDFYINGTIVGSATDDRLPDAGPFGFISMSAGTVNMKTSVEKLQFWKQ